MLCFAISYVYLITCINAHRFAYQFVATTSVMDVPFASLVFSVFVLSHFAFVGQLQDRHRISCLLRDLNCDW